MLWYVILPQLWPATFIAFVVTIIGALRSFDLISIMTRGGPSDNHGSYHIICMKRPQSMDLDGLWRRDSRSFIFNYARLYCRLLVSMYRQEKEFG